MFSPTPGQYMRTSFLVQKSFSPISATIYVFFLKKKTSRRTSSAEMHSTHRNEENIFGICHQDA